MLPSTLLPNADRLRLDGLAISEQQVQLKLLSQQRTVVCPSCGQEATRVHSHYERTVADQPWGHRSVQLQIQVRRFFCDNAACPRQTFAEPLAGLAARHARRSHHLAVTQRLLGLALGGEAGARLAGWLAMPVSGDTLLRLVRATPELEPPHVRRLGIDDWAFRKGHQYGTVLVDLDRHQRIDLLPDREVATVAAWLRQHPEIEVVARDRAQAYIEAITQGAPQAQQVADRFHLLANLREALQRFFDRHPAELKQVKLSLPPPAARSEAEKPLENQVSLPPLRPRGLNARNHTLEQRAGRRVHRQAQFDEVHALAKQGLSQRQIARRLKISRAKVGQWLAKAELPPRGYGSVSTVAPWLAYLQERWQAGCRRPRQLWRELQQQGYPGSEVAVWRQTLRLREAEPLDAVPVPKPPSPHPPLALSARQASWIVFHRPAELKPEQQDWLKRIQEICPLVTATSQLVLAFRDLVRDRAGQFAEWLNAAETSGVRELRNFATGLRADYAAVAAALSQAVNNGATEGHVNRLKLIKRQMFGRAKFDLLRKRVLFAP